MKWRVKAERCSFSYESYKICITNNTINVMTRWSNDNNNKVYAYV